MTVYGDIAFVLNFAVNALLLLGSARLSGAAFAWWRLLLAAALGALYALLTLYPQLRLLRTLPFRGLICAGMIALAFGLRKSSLRQGLLFFGLSAAFAGLVVALGGLTGGRLLQLGRSAYYVTDFQALVLLCGACYLLCSLALRGILLHSGAELLPVTLTLGERHVALTALRDTGNTLRDPITNAPVLLVHWTVAGRLLPQSGTLCAADFAQPYGLLLRWRAYHPRLIPYRAVGTAGGVLLAIRCDSIRIGKRRYSGGLAAFSPTAISDGGNYEALAGGMQNA